MKKKILVFHHCGTLGGGSLSCFDLIDMLSQDYNVYLAIVNPTEKVNSIVENLNVAEKFILDGYPSLTYHNANHSFLKSVIKYFTSKKYINQWVKIADEVEPDVVVLNSSVLAPMIVPLKEKGLKTLCIVRETMYKTTKLYLNKWLCSQLSKASAVAFLTEYDLNTWKVKSDFNFVLPDVVNERFYFVEQDNMSVENEEFTILYLGGIVLEKGVETLIDAYELMSSDLKSKLVILGGDPYKKTTDGLLSRFLHKKEISRATAVRNKIFSFNEHNKEIELVGVVLDTSKYYMSADVVVFPVSEIHQPRPAYEAGFFKKPIVLPDCPNFKENVTDGENGVYYKKGDARSLAYKLYDIATGKYCATSMGENNSNFIKSKHSIEAVRLIALDALQKIID